MRLKALLVVLALATVGGCGDEVEVNEVRGMCTKAGDKLFAAWPHAWNPDPTVRDGQAMLKGGAFVHPLELHRTYCYVRLSDGHIKLDVR